jgi:hypothetical protein
VKGLQKYCDYNREEIHDIFSPDTPFKRGTGTWGLQGIIKVPHRSNDFVFMVTFGQQQADHVFDEGITEDGILTWQSQPKQKLADPTIRKFIEHEHLIDNIYLFLRTREGIDYTYLGRLAHVSHDIEREQPVYFKWQIFDWDISSAIVQRMGLVLQKNEFDVQAVSNKGLVQTPPPFQQSLTKGSTTRDFRSRKVNFDNADQGNKRLGNLGELLILDFEKQFLIENGRADLAEKVIHTAEVVGDGAGYDIESYELTGDKKYIEVKTTCGDAQTSFYMTINEVEFARLHAPNFTLARVYEYNKKNNSGKFYCIYGADMHQLKMAPIQFRVSI